MNSTLFLAAIIAASMFWHLCGRDGNVHPIQDV